MRILAIDPGETSGFALSDDGLGEWPEAEECWQEPTKTHADLWLIIGSIQPLTIVCEKFHMLERTGQKSYTAELVGVVKLWGQEHNAKVVMQNNGAKQGWPDNKIKMLGLWKPGLRHGMDALRHMLTYKDSLGLVDYSKMK